MSFKFQTSSFDNNVNFCERFQANKNCRSQLMVTISKRSPILICQVGMNLYSLLELYSGNCAHILSGN